MRQERRGNEDLIEILSDESVQAAERLIVDLHYARRTDLYSLCSKYEPELYAKSQGKAKIPTATRWAVWRRDDYTCHYCGVRGNDLTLDHIVPETHGGTLETDNLITACGKCNAKKGSIGYEEFLKSPWLAKKKKHQATLITAKPPNLPAVKS